MPTLEELLAESRAASDPTVTGSSNIGPGGVDPLGLRQINFDLMDQVLPGLNNVADRLRPFVVMAWAWRRVRVVMERDGSTVSDQDARDFVDRIEAIYAWSQFLVDPDAPIPGGQALTELISGGAKAYTFGGSAWVARRGLRRTSTGLISPLNYGPGLRAMGWLLPIGPRGVFRPNPELEPALDAFEAGITNELHHDAFNKFGAVVVQRDEALKWGTLWAISGHKAVERAAGWARLAGPTASPVRRAGLAFVRAVAKRLPKNSSVDAIRWSMAEPSSDGDATDDDRLKAAAWRNLQVRQLFRFALEAWLFWIIGQLIDGPPKSSEAIAQQFIANAGGASNDSAADWFALATDVNPVDLITRLSRALGRDAEESIPAAIRAALQCCLAEGLIEPSATKGFDRLPLRRAVTEFETWCTLDLRQCLARMIEVWIMAQHAYWCVSRGLADARGRGKRLLRLRVVMGEGGWTTTPGTRRGNPPVPTADRLATAVSLLRECGQL